MKFFRIAWLEIFCHAGSFAELRVVDKRIRCEILNARLVASVAQLVEQLTLNQLVVGSNPPRGTSLHSPLRCELRLGKLEPSLFDVPVLAEHLKGGSEDFFFREQEQCGNDFWVFALPAHASGGGKNFIASFDGGFSGQRAKPGAQFWLVRNGLD